MYIDMGQFRAVVMQLLKVVAVLPFGAVVLPSFRAVAMISCTAVGMVSGRL
jgi:hypothetical protein